MAASSVSGTAPGDASGKNKGSEHMTLGVTHLIGPKILVCGVATLTGTTHNVQHPDLGGTASDYAIFLQGNSSTYAYVSVHTATDGFQITAGSGNTVFWSVVEKGIA